MKVRVKPRKRIVSAWHLLILLQPVLWLSACAVGDLFSKPDTVVPETPGSGAILWRDFSTHDDPVRTLAMEGDTLWMGTMKGVIRFDTRKAEYKIYTPKSTNGGFISGGVYIIAVDSRGNKWVGTYGGRALAIRWSNLEALLTGRGPWG